MPPERPSQKPDPDAPATLLVFTLDAAGERARRRLLPGSLGSWEIALFHDRLDGALAAGRANGCDLEVCAPRRLSLADDVEQFTQEGRGFGDRLRRAIAHRQPSAERPLVVVGSDAPGLAPAHVAAALERLAEQPDQLVVGPSPDGGFYLLAAARPVEALLAEVRWLRSDTLASLIVAARARGIEVSLLAPLADLDRATDLDGWIKRREAQESAWFDRLIALLRLLRRPLLPTTLGQPLPARAAIAPARGPPG